MGADFLVASELGELRMELSLPLPPTDNNIYVNLSFGRALRSDAKRYKALVKESAARVAIKHELSFRQHVACQVRVHLFMDMYTKGWPKNAKWKFRKLDATNRTKLLLDALAESVGIDDRHFVSVLVRKEHKPDNQYVRLVLEELWPRY